VAQQALARDVTRRVHGDVALQAAEQVSGLYFGGLDPRELSDEAFAILRTESRFREVSLADLAFDETRVDVAKMLIASESAASNGAAKKLIEQGSISINKQKVPSDGRYLSSEGLLLRGGHIVVGKGKKDFALLRVRD
jgi:tyrosyl-tRNA synthetase